MDPSDWLREASARLRELNPDIALGDALDLVGAIANLEGWLEDPGVAVDCAFLRELGFEWRPAPAGWFRREAVSDPTVS